MDQTMPEGSVRRITLQGEYDLGERRELSTLFGSLSPNGPLEIELTDVTYADSTFLSELGKLRARLDGQKITLIGVSKAMQRVLQIVGFDQLFEIAPA